MAQHSNYSRVHFSVEKMLEGKMGLKLTPLYWPDVHEANKSHMIFKTEGNNEKHVYRCVILNMILTKADKTKTVESYINLFAGKEVKHNVDAIYERFEEIYLKNTPDNPQKISCTDSFDTFMGVDESIPKELERSLDKLREPFLSKITADNMVEVHIKTPDYEIMINPPVDVKQIPNMDYLRGLQLIYNQFASSPDRYISGNIPSSTMCGNIPYDKLT